MPEATTPELDLRSSEYLPLHELKPAKRNPKGHDLPAIMASLRRFGVTQAIASIDERTGRMVLGHGRRAALLAMHDDDEDAPKGVRVTDDGEWLVPVSTKEADAALVGDNELTIAGGWDDPVGLHSMLDGLGDNLAGTGYTRGQVEELGLSLRAIEPRDRSGDGGVLDVLDVSLGEPRHEVARHDEYLLSGRHRLVVARVMQDHHLWAHYLTEDPEVLFCPYPGLFFALSAAAEEHPLLLVQPDLYLAGHLLDKYASVHGDRRIEKVEPQA
jgi:hypothetical protein